MKETQFKYLTFIAYFSIKHFDGNKPNKLARNWTLLATKVTCYYFLFLGKLITFKKPD